MQFLYEFAKSYFINKYKIIIINQVIVLFL